MYKELLKIIKKYNTIIIHRHQKPDGDALGSQFGLQRILQLNYPKKEILVVGDQKEFNNNPIKNIFKNKFDHIEEGQYEGALSIVVDTANAERIEGSNFFRADFVYKIDHHASGDEFSNAEIVLDKYSSASEIISEIADELKWEIDKKAAEYLLTGMVTDSGRFMFNSVSENTFYQASLLTKAGAKTSKIAGLLNDKNVNFLRLQGAILQNFKVDNNIAFYMMPKGLHKKYNVDYNTASALIYLIMGAKEIKYGLYSTYNAEAKVWRTSLRSKAKDINKIAERHNGGGHRMASGAKLKNKKEFNQVLNELKEIA